MDGAMAGSEELFVLPRGADRYYLYAPLRRVVAEANAAAVEAVAQYLHQPRATLAPQAAAVIEQLRAQGLFREPLPQPPLFPEAYDFYPHEVTLFPTSRCNLRCRYCYANAGCKAVDMPWEVAQAAIDLVAANAGWLGSPRFAVGFHGGGEPMLAWDMVVRAVEYARRKAEQTGLEAEVYAATNGLLTPEQREFVARHFSTLTVSLDGPPEVQDHNRPTLHGGGSYALVAATLRDFDARGFPYGLRSTITATTAGRMAETVDWLASEFRTQYLHLEPVWLCGRCATTGERPPTDEDFVREFLRARDAGRRRGIGVFYSGARLDVLTSKFCGAPGDGFSVLPEGLITSCYEITDVRDPRAATFHYGRYLPEKGRFEFDRQRIAALQKYSVDHWPHCADCFCRWHCAGDCLSKVFEKSGGDCHQGSDRCRLNRALTLADLDEVVSAARREPSRDGGRGADERDCENT